MSLTLYNSKNKKDIKLKVKFNNRPSMEDTFL